MVALQAFAAVLSLLLVFIGFPVWVGFVFGAEYGWLSAFILYIWVFLNFLFNKD